MVENMKISHVLVCQVAFGETGSDPEFFEYFCEKAILASFVKALRLGPAVQTQVRKIDVR